MDSFHAAADSELMSGSELDGRASTMLWSAGMTSFTPGGDSRSLQEPLRAPAPSLAPIAANADAEAEEDVVGAAESAVTNLRLDTLWARGLTGISLGAASAAAAAARGRGDSKIPCPEGVTCLADVYSESFGVLGRGSFGVVREGLHRSTNTRVAVKTVRRDIVDSRYVENHVIHDMFGNLLHMSLDRPHCNVIRYLDFLLGPQLIYVIMEELNGNELFAELQQHAPVSQAFCVRAMRQLLSAVKHICSCNIIHRDVKVEALRFRERTPSSDLVLFDFGHCCFADDDGRRDAVGTATYMAPEVLGHVYDSKVDVLSAGVVLYIMLTGKVPFRFDPARRISPVSDSDLQRAFTAKELQSAPVEATKLLKSLVVLKPHLRSTAADALQHTWLSMEPMSKDGMDASRLVIQRESYQTAEMECSRSTVLGLPATPHAGLRFLSTEILQEEAYILSQGAAAKNVRLASVKRHPVVSEDSTSTYDCSTEVLRERIEVAGCPPVGISNSSFIQGYSTEVLREELETNANALLEESSAQRSPMFLPTHPYAPVVNFAPPGLDFMNSMDSESEYETTFAGRRRLSRRRAARAALKRHYEEKINVTSAALDAMQARAVEEPANICYRHTIALACAKLQSREKLIAPEPFNVEFGSQIISFRFHIIAKLVHQRRHGHCFRTSSGIGSLELKCDADALNLNEEMSRFTFYLKVGIERRGPFTHDFSTNPVARLPPDKMYWDFRAASCPKDKTFTIALEVLSAGD
eukprot:TRINITY_DN24348_c0_g1_i2.p1 TRINITY_DN24348_c0_g1~~TRINITY_DN24348_c0_g1_i2.p1  ORF type:complete len:752 (+),score=106.95 TRINITY_DN24348_c0_g1_i2:2-2257(+)